MLRRLQAFFFPLTLCLLALSGHCAGDEKLRLQLSLVRRQYDPVPVHLNEDEEAHAREFFQFVTRPDINAPRWKINTYDNSAITPGYWFTAFYEHVDQTEQQRHPWIGPFIYDQKGELIWSGSQLLDGWVINDFRVSAINGVDKLTATWAEKGSNLVLNSSYQVDTLVKVGKNGLHLNIHDWNIVWNGTRALAMTSDPEEASQEETNSIGFKHGLCKVSFPGFEEFNTTDWKPLFKWSSEDKIHLKDVFVGNDCRHGWDYLHANSIDKFEDGDYLYSGRFTDTVYKISAKDGSFVWRLSHREKDSDFQFDGEFKGQHHVRVVTENSTHVLISLIDNTIRPGSLKPPSYPSRGMTILLHLNANPMKAEIVKIFEHPRGETLRGRGSLQFLDGGNAFAGWWWKSLISEYSEDGKLLMDAETVPELKSYRSYKLPWVGQPNQRPDVLSVAVLVANVTNTAVFVSWNGATEVSKWNVWQTTSGGGSRTFIVSAPRRGFETSFSISDFLEYLVIEAVDANGVSLGETALTKTIPLGEIDELSAETGAVHKSEPQFAGYFSFLQDPIWAFLGGITACTVMFATIWLVCGSQRYKSGINWWKNWRRQPQHEYERVLNEELDKEVVGEEVSLEDLDAKASAPNE